MANVRQPKEGGRREPTSPQKKNGNIYNPPRYEEIGGLDGAGKWTGNYPFKIKPVGNAR